MQDELIPARFTDVARYEGRGGVPDGPLVTWEAAVLETDDDRLLAIHVSRVDAANLALALTGTTTSRPLTHRFASELLVAAGGRLAMVVIDALKNDTYYAKAVVTAGGGATTGVDARPSDCLALSVILDCPIFVRASVLGAAAIARSSVKESWFKARASELASEYMNRSPGPRLVAQSEAPTENSLLTRDLKLTSREEQVLRLVAAGNTNVEVGHALGLSPFTVTRHLANVYSKLGVSRRAQAVTYLPR